MLVGDDQMAVSVRLRIGRQVSPPHREFASELDSLPAAGQPKLRKGIICHL